MPDGEVARLDQRHVEAARGRVQRAARAGRAAADHDDVEHLVGPAAREPAARCSGRAESGLRSFTGGLPFGQDRSRRLPTGESRETDVTSLALAAVDLGRARRRVPRHVRHHPVRRRGRRDGRRRAQPVRPRRAGLRRERRLAADRASAGASRCASRVYVAGGVSGAHLNPAVTLAHGAGGAASPGRRCPRYMRGAGARRVRRRRARLPQLPLRDRLLRGRRPDRPRQPDSVGDRSASSAPSRRRTSSSWPARSWTR